LLAPHASRITHSPRVRDFVLEQAFAQRKDWAYEAAYRRFGGRLYATALHLLRDTQSAQDCVHDVLLHLWKKTSAYAPERGVLEAFLVTCVRNEALTRLRNDARRAQLRQALVEPDRYDLDIDPIEHARIERAIAQLDPAHQKMVQLAYYRGLTHREIAAELAEPIGTIKSRISAALRSLRRTLAPPPGETA
jgi:RNA polymerase sigma-70 factor (ECF subfamily)